MSIVVQIEHRSNLDDYAEIAHLAQAVGELRGEAQGLVPLLEGRTVWMVNSTSRGGGVAEMLPTLIHLLRELGVSVEWAVLDTDHQGFFPLTKRIHNLIHGEGDPHLTRADRELYDAVSRENAERLRPLVRREDILVVHDPQPLGVGAILKEQVGLQTIWRCHIGLDRTTPETEAAWEFLRPYANSYDHSVFSAPEYIPSFLAGRATIIHPSVDPLSHKNQELPLQRLVGVLVDSALLRAFGPVVMPPFAEPAQRLQPDGTFAPATNPDDIGLLFRPIVTQVSRWDRLKGFEPLLDGFVRLKEMARAGPGRRTQRHQRTLELVRLVLAGPDPKSIQDDPEGSVVLDELRTRYLSLDPELQADIAIITLPMGSRMENALMVNTLQRSATIVVQNSLREGFGLTATEAMWKRVPVLGTHACGLRQQIRDGLDGRLIEDPTNPQEIATVLDEMLGDPIGLERMARQAQRRVHDEFLIFSQLRQWLRVLAARRPV